MATKSEKEAAREIVRADDAEVISRLAKDVQAFHEKAQAASCESNAYATLLNKIRALNDAMIRAIDAGVEA